MRRSRFLGAFGAFLGAVVFSYPPPAGANIFSVNPIRIYLSSKSTSALLTVHNDSSEQLRFQVAVFAWDESPKAETLLTPTEDIIFFPALMTIAPGKERKIRIGTTIPFPAQEKSYRIFVQELPPEQKPDPSKQAANISMLTRMAIPIFLVPESKRPTEALEDLSVGDGKFLFSLKNTGNVHFLAQKVQVQALPEKGAALIDKELPTWYVLAGRLRAYFVDVPKAVCSSIRSFHIRVELGDRVLEKTHATPGGACGSPTNRSPNPSSF